MFRWLKEIRDDIADLYRHKASHGHTHTDIYGFDRIKMLEEHTRRLLDENIILYQRQEVLDRRNQELMQRMDAMDWEMIR